MKLGAMVAVSSFALSQVAVGQAVQWKVGDGGNGHWYSVLRDSAGFDLATARVRADAIGASLFTGCGSEFDFAVANSGALDPSGWVPFGTHLLGPWIGLSRAAQGFVWLDETTCTFDRWDVAAQQPDMANEDGVMLYSMHRSVASRCHDVGSERLSRSAIIEWSADCNSDGIVDYGQCRDGSLPDYNGNNIPDCCEQGAPCVVGNYAVQWRVEHGGNGHWYHAVPDPCNWNAAREKCVASGGALATLTSAEENLAVFTLMNSAWHSTDGPWLGGFQAPGSAEPAGGWQWVTGEVWNFQNWDCSNPNNFGSYGAEDSLDYGWDPCTNAFAPTWNDSSALKTNPGYIIEWSADCNSDGIVDYGQILLGQLADVDANGVPDVCEYYEVPSEFATIQAAIDAVPAGQYGLVLVAAGTRNESFSLNGKNVRVQGAANNATILDGTGLTTSIARFTGGEPATAGLANLVFRNGTAGSRISPKAPFTVGGAVYGINASASITNCRFEQNRANYGGAVYLLYSSMAVDNCDFAGNTAIDEGGGVLVYETTGALTGCDFTQNVCGLSGPGSGSGFKSVGARVAGETVLLSGCTFTGGIAGVDGSAVEHFENAANVRGKLRMVGCTVTGNSSGIDAAGLRMTGAQASCVLAGGTTVCSNTPRNVDGPFLIEGSATVCGCMADVTGDGAVNGGDLGVVLSSWGGADASGTGDVNHDGVVNGSDLAIVLSSWGACGG